MTMFSKRHYHVLAKAFQRTMPQTIDPLSATDAAAVGRWEQWEIDRRAIIVVLARDNRNFNSEKFVANTEDTDADRA